MLVFVDEREGELESGLLRRPARRQPLADAADVVLQELILHDLILLQDLLGVGFAELDILLLGKEVEAGLQRVAGPAGSDVGATAARMERHKARAFGSIKISSAIINAC